MTKKKPIVSILLPVYNGGRFIKKSIESVLSQSFKDFELLVIDDGSVDDTESIVSGFEKKDSRIRFLKNELNLGIQKTLNRGLEEASGEYVARIDDDDRWVDKDKMLDQVFFLDKNLKHGIVGTGVVVVDESGKELFRYIPPSDDKDIRAKMLFKSLFTHSSVMFRKDVVVSLGGYGEDNEVRHVEDYDLWLRIGEKYKFAIIPKYSTEFTLRKGTISATYKPEQFRKNISLIRKYKNSYPSFYRAITLGYMRLFAYYFYKHIPFKSLQAKILEIYKNS